MASTDLHIRFIDFAGGMPAFGFSLDTLRNDIATLQSALAGVYPGKPNATMANISMPLYRLAYSAFLDTLQVNIVGGAAQLTATIRATIHPKDQSNDVIRSYLVSTVDPIVVILDYDQAARRLFWRQQGSPVVDMQPAWGADADAILASTTIPSPQKDTFLKEVEQPSFFSTQNMFVQLLVALLPSYELGEIAPWLTLLEPLRYDYAGNHFLVTAQRAQISVGGCDPKLVTVEPDPDFPYGMPIPSPSMGANRVDFAVYLPKTRFINFVSGVLEPAVLVSTGGGGLIKWSAAGAFGLKKLTADIATGITYGNAKLTVTGNIGLAAVIDFLGTARAWVDGPSGLKIGLASVSLTGTGNFAAQIRLTVDPVAGFVYADLVVTQADVTPNFDTSTGLPWPIDDVIDLVLDRVAHNEVKKLVGQVTHLGRWDFMGIPSAYLDHIPGGVGAVPIMEGLEGVSAYVGIGRANIG